MSFIVGIVSILPHFGHRGCLISNTISPGICKNICPQRIHFSIVIYTIRQLLKIALRVIQRISLKISSKHETREVFSNVSST